MVSKPVTLSSRDAFYPILFDKFDTTTNGDFVSIELDFRSTHSNGVLISNELIDRPALFDKITVYLKGLFNISTDNRQRQNSVSWLSALFAYLKF